MNVPASQSPSAFSGERLRIRGLVQGVGFRPMVWRLARECGLSGEVLNDGAGVLIRIWGPSESRGHFLDRLRAETPPLARIDGIERSLLADSIVKRAGFRIAASQGGDTRTGVVPDAATCPACLAEILEPSERRFRYPFTNCTHCGPRLSILAAIPYDRANTSMAAFSLCADCQAEYEQPADRRFHAQPIACPACGPRVWLEGRGGGELVSSPGMDPVATAADLLNRGQILAIKGIGGFHLACDAGNARAVALLRQRKGRFAKPFALMARDTAIVRRYCRVSSEEQALLEGLAAPIVVLPIAGPQRVAEAVAPGQGNLGFMLPYTPLHHLLLEGWDRPIVLTSGNLSHEPQCIDNAVARDRLGEIADVLLLHDRNIVNRVDDSVVRMAAGVSRLLRRARGFAPAPMPLPPGFVEAAPLLALGGELKSTFCLAKDGQAILSQHVGDLENAATYSDYQRNIALYMKLFQHAPKRLVVDLHPDYCSTRFGHEWAERDGLDLVTVQHHHAHIASCMAENGLPWSSPPVLGVALDGLGFGADGTFWGGEFLLADYRRFRRLAALRPVAMPGGARAIHEPWRNTYAHLVAALGWEAYQRDHPELELTRFLESRPLAILGGMLERGINSPLASSCGRLFDAVAAALGVCRTRTFYEGQAAMELESVVDERALELEDESLVYPLSIVRQASFHWLDFEPLWRALLDDCSRRTPIGVMAARFHKGLAKAVADMVVRLSHEADARLVDTVALSGGVFQNRVLLEWVIRYLREERFEVLTHSRLPANDGGLALGQAVIALTRGLDVIE